MNLIPVSLAVFYRWNSSNLDVWVQKRTDDGPFHGLLEFPGGGIEPGESPLEAVRREVEEEVGIQVNVLESKFMGIYPIERETKTILLYVFLFPEHKDLIDKGEWLKISPERMSESYKGIIPPPNHQIIDDLFKSFYDSNRDGFLK